MSSGGGGEAGGKAAGGKAAGGGAPGEATPPYTVVNLKQVENMAPRFGLSPGFESRFARVPLELRNSGLSYFRIAPGFRSPFGHHHVEQEEIYLVVSGSARAKLDDRVIELAAWDALRVAPETMRALEGGPEGAEIVAFGAPSNQNRDAQVVQGWWTD
jgi:mannose-6-phosphate isomerase-like protein (cupin superfamily)